MTGWICADCGDGRCEDCLTPRCDHDCQGLNDIDPNACTDPGHPARPSGWCPICHDDGTFALVDGPSQTTR